jgi:putative colanic acid biosynthesis acetyltransferase WcaF
MVLRGVTVGTDAVVGAGAVAHRDVTAGNVLTAGAREAAVSAGPGGGGTR